MSERYFLEGHRPKTMMDDVDTLLFEGEGYPTLEDATAKAQEYFKTQPDLGLAVIYQVLPDGTRDGVKFFFKGEEGELEDLPLYWGACDRCIEG